MKRERITPTQRLILQAAAGNDLGLVIFGGGDRAGTRVSSHDPLGTPIIRAYGWPEGFLKARGLLAPHGNDRHTFAITAKGLAALGIACGDRS